MPKAGHKLRANNGVLPSKEPERQHHSRTMEEKARFIASVLAAKEKDEKASLTYIARQHGIKASTAHDIWSKRHNILAIVKGNPSQVAKNALRNRKRTMEAVEDALYEWYLAQRKLGINLTDARLQGTAVVLWGTMKDYYASNHRPDPIAFSSGWLRGFKTRRGISKYTGHGESGSVDLASYRSQIEDAQRKLVDFNPNDIYNCDETGLYLKTLSNKTLETGQIRGKKIVRAARVSILLCSNATGSDKRKLFVLSKSHPRGLKEETLGRIDADTKCSGYMTHSLFDKWLKDLNKDMQQQGRKIGLLIGSAGGHGRSEDAGLTNVTIIRLPSNATSLIHPLDAGAIRSFKLRYSQEMLEIIARARAETGNPNATVPNRVLWACLVESWKKVAPDYIRNCFIRVPIMPRAHRDLLRSLGVETGTDQIIRLQEELIKKYQEIEDVISKQKDFSVLNYINMCNSEGPSKAILAFATKIMSDDKYQDVFKQHECDFIDEDEIDEDDDLYMDYEAPQRPREARVIFVLRNRTVTATEPPLEEHSSSESSPRKKELSYIREICQGLANATQDILDSDNPRLLHEFSRFYRYAESFLDRIRVLENDDCNSGHK